MAVIAAIVEISLLTSLILRKIRYLQFQIVAIHTKRRVVVEEEEEVDEEEEVSY